MNILKTALLLALWVLASAPGAGFAQPEQPADKTLSPYFFVHSDDPELDRLPLKSTGAEVRIAGVIADVLVRQVYQNQGRRPLEAIYVFPASTRAAVYGMRMKIGERVIEARIDRREQARQLYEAARQAGQSASLLEQQRPNVFQMNVANILPGDVIEVELRYTELLVPVSAVYEFVYPTVVGPRYTGESAPDAPLSEGWVANPYLHQGEKASYTFDINVNLSTGMKIQDAVCPSHKVRVGYDGPAAARIALDPAEKSGGNRDFILRYRLAGGSIETGLLLFQGEPENFFLLMVQPPKKVAEKAIPPREYIFVVDVSGSMHGFPLDISKTLLRDLIGGLRPEDRFNVVLFAGGASVLAEQSIPASAANIQRGVNLIDRQRGGGGTNLLAALRRALALPKTEGCSRTVVIATDGYVNVETEAFDLIRHNLGRANLFAFGIGSSVNRLLIEGMARVGMGEPFVVTRAEEAPAMAGRLRELIRTPVLTAVELDFEGFEAYDVEPVSIPDVLAERPVVVFGKWRGQAAGTIRVRGKSGGGAFQQTLEVGGRPPAEANSGLRYLWARHRVALLSDYNRLAPQDERVEEITNLGLAYNLLTAYTSFVAVDSLKRLSEGQATTVRQPLPLPQGVSDLAVGGKGGLALQAPGARRMSSTYAASPATGNAQEGAADFRRERVGRDEPLPEDKAAEEEGGKLLLKQFEVRGALDAAGIEALIRSRIPALEACLQQVLGAAGEAKQEFRLTLNVSARGLVERVGLADAAGEQALKRLETCLGNALKTLRLPVTADGQGAQIRFSLALR